MVRIVRLFYSFVVLVTILIILARCSDNSKRAESTGQGSDLFRDSASISNQVPAAACVGEWAYNFTFYSSELNIKDDGTFTFHDQGCMGHKYSEGTWSALGAMVILKSFDRYGEDNQIEWESVEPETGVAKSKVEPSPVKPEREGGKIEYHLDSSIFNIEMTYKIKMRDTANVFFDNVRLRMSGGGLQQLDVYGSLTDTKYIRVK